MLSSGGTYSAAAEAAGRAISTVSKWIGAWRSEYGDDLFRTENAERRAQQTEAAREAAEQMWSDLRAMEARNLAVTASQIRGRILAILPTVGTRHVDRNDRGESPVVVAGPDAREIKALADATVRLIEAAELLDDRPTRHLRRSVPSDQWINPSGGSASEGSTDTNLQRAVMSDPELAEQFAVLAEQAWARAHPDS